MEILKGFADHFCVCAIRIEEGDFSILTVNGEKGRKVVVFDHKGVAQDFLDLLANGRLSIWDEAKEQCTYSPILPDKYNQAIIITDYDPHNVPANFVVSSETPGKAWKYHIQHWEAFYDVGGNMEMQDDGKLINHAINS